MNWQPAVVRLPDKIRRRGFFDRLYKCNFCDRTDLVFPTSALTLCARCAKEGYWDLKEIKLLPSGICDICGVLFQAPQGHAAGIFVSQAWACWKCTWSKMGHIRNRYPATEFRV